MGRQITVKVISSMKACNVYSAPVQLDLGGGDIQEC
jgi:hypothetical protein